VQELYRHVGVNITSLTVEAVGGTRQGQGQKHFRARPAGEDFRLNVAKLSKLIEERFGGKDPAVVQNALTCFQRGLQSLAGKPAQDLPVLRWRKEDRHQVVMNGNEALAYGLIAAGVRFGAGYPITPWSGHHGIAPRELPKYGGTFVQTEDEIAAISMAIGCQLWRRVAVTGFQRSWHLGSRPRRLGGRRWRKCLCHH